MVNSISDSSSAAQYQPRVEQDYKMTDDQKKELNDVLDKYDPKNMTKDQTKSMMDEIKSLGIKPGEDLKSALEAKGFKVHGRHHRHQQQSSSSAADASSTADTATPSAISDFLKSIQNGTATKDEITKFIENMKNSDNSSSGQLVDQKA